jgi:hypothetical protein
MSGLDTLIAKSLEITLKEKLGEQTFQKIQARILEKHGIEFKEAIEDFQKLDSVLREFFGSRAEYIEKQIIDDIVTLEESKQQKRKWITITNAALIKLVLESIGDEDKKNILNAVLDESRIISDVLEISNIPQTSGYRKINGLIQNGMLVPHGFLIARDGKKITKYKSVFENINIEIVKNKVFVRVLPSEESIAKSAIMQLSHS